MIMTINKRYVEMEKFLKFWADILKQNPEYNINYKSIYNRLITLGVPTDDFGCNNNENGNFDYWQQQFSGNVNTKVFVSINWSYFCQFINYYTDEHSIQNASEHIKMYIPLDRKHIKKGAEIIFNFLSKNDIKHISKIATDIRFDGIVIRLTSEEDALKLQNFIDNNQYLQDGLLPPNPFTFNQNNIAYACDGMLSYNENIAKMIAIYLNKRKNELDKIKLQDFINFVYEYFQNTFINKMNEQEFIDNFGLIKEDKIFLKERILNYKQIFELFLKSIHPDFKIEHLFIHFNNNKEENKQLSQIICQLKQLKIRQFELSPIIVDCYTIMAAKYSPEIAMNNIIEYIRSNNSACLTRDNNIRQKFIDLNIREHVLAVCKAYDCSIREVISKCLDNFTNSKLGSK